MLRLLGFLDSIDNNDSNAKTLTPKQGSFINSNRPFVNTP